jgi:PQQ enzyme repeat.
LRSIGNHEGQEGPRRLYALDRQTGAELWTFQADSRILSAPGVGNGVIYVQAFSGTLYAVE